MTIRIKIVKLFEKLLGVRIVRPRQVGTVYEEEHLARFLNQFSIDCVLDVGANEGQYATMLRHRAGYKGLIVSFEPILEIANTLAEKARADKNWVVIPRALDEISRTAVLNVMNSSVFTSLNAPAFDQPDIFSKENKVIRRVELETSTLQREMEELSSRYDFQRPFLKLDTQGHDLAVAKGSGTLLKKFVGIQTELSIVPIYENSEGFVSTINWFNASGFSLSAFVPNNQGHFPRLIETDAIFVNNLYSTIGDH